MLNELSEAIAGAEDHAIEMFLGQLQLATDLLPVLVVEIEPDQYFPIPCNRHLLEHPPRRRGPLRSSDTFPVRVVLGSRKFIQGVGTGRRAAVLATVISQVVKCHTIEISAQILRVCDFSSTKLLERCDRGVLQNVRGHLRIAHPPQDQRAKAGIVAIHCGQVGNRVRYGRGEVRLWGKHPHGCRLVNNLIHDLSISRDHEVLQPSTRTHPVGRHLLAAIVLAGWAVPGYAAGLSCTRALGAPAVTEGPLRTLGREPAAQHFLPVSGHAYLIQVEERDNDALVEVLDSRNQTVARADHPERRTGTRRVVVTAPDSTSLLVRVTGKEHAGAAGMATVEVFDLATLRARPDCLAILKSLAEADADYAAGEAISSGRSTSAPHEAREAFMRAAQAYSTAEQALGASADQPLRGQTALALAGVEYFNLQEWAQAVDWAQTAVKALPPDDPYRRARAEALLAAAWIEIGSTAAAGRAVSGYQANSSELLTRARQLLQQLLQFHLQRGERYDAGLQLTNIGLTYLNEGSYRECVRSSAAASRLFESIHETQRRALAWQNRALCLWGLGQLPEALRWFERALADIGPEPYPSMHLIVLTNTALANYALGHFDESLRLYDRALSFTQKVQSARDEAYCLYGIGVNYYALGDRQRAREFLERSLAIRTVALDGRGRMASLRALATIDAEQGRVKQALASDSEALGLAIAPSAIARIKIQQAAHTAAAGRPVEAKALLDAVLSAGAEAGALIQAEALLQRAVLLRGMGHAQEALADLAAARPGLHNFGSVMEEFEGELELARALRQVGQPDAALAAVERALGQSDAVRLQTANPELRAQMQTPLRPAFDLKLELLRDRYEHALAVGQERDAQALAAVAFATADASRAHSFADVAAQKYSPAVRRELASDFQRREELYRELSARRFALDARLERSGTDDPRVRHLIADVAELRREVDTVNTGIASRTATNGALVRTTRERANIPSLAAGTALVSYWLGSESAYAWVVLPGEMRWTRLASPAAIADQAAAFHRSLTRLVDTPVERRLQDASALYTMIIRPLEPWLSGARNWVVIPDGALAYVPFAALQMRYAQPESFAAMQHDVAVTPAAWMLDTSHARALPHDHRKILLVADPVYEADDPRLATVKNTLADAPTSAPRGSDPTPRDYRRLRFTAQEAAGIAAQFPPADVDQLIGVNATRERLLALDWSRYRFIHIATHGIVDAQVPELSALILGSYDAGGAVSDRQVRVADVSLQTLTADVAVLSACETALGKEVRSEGLVGMSSTILARGARAVVASLWPVPDEIGARLMTEFYQHMLHDSMAPEAALGTAMRSMVLQDQRADPALWAAFQVSVATLQAPSHPPSTVKLAMTAPP
jgi:CHAT domain-containing protein/tetratricopeptide (TPR) repeat protein